MMTKPYRPANGIDGEAFMEQWCQRCQHIGAAPEESDCEIVLRSMMHDIDSPEYPQEWVRDDDETPHGNPRCTAFAPKEKAP